MTFFCYCSFELYEVGLGNVLRSHLKYYKSTDAEVHPDYDPNTLANNLGIIFVKERIELTEHIKAISLVPDNIQSLVLPFTSEQGSITGFGLIHGSSNHFPSRLQRGFHRVLSTADCHWRYPHLSNVSTVTHFCGLDDDRQRSNICGGDQGTAFTVMLRGVETLVCIGCCFDGS